MSLHDDPSDSRIDENEATKSTVSRRRVVVGLVGAAGALVATPVIATSMLRHDDDDDAEKDSDQDDHDDDHDDGDLDDDDDAVRESLVEGSTEVHIIDDDADGFLPGVLRVAVGQTVTFYNDDDDDHTATGADFDTGIMHPGGSAQVTFDTPGSFAYTCQIHPEMLGTIEVNDGAATPAATPAASPEAPDSRNATVVRMVNIAFDPSELEISAGTSVTWINEEQVPHTATALDGSFDTGTLEQDDEASVTFDAPGTYEYRCTFHPSMTATISVT
ncbi:MAG TPA: plastocyanin/azurin family copper-binding protein [Thermomicrobiales bacterium]|nr:plastocyanin/azurin family copper-binding protein [Thermomicrobiales bacterium]